MKPGSSHPLLLETTHCPAAESILAGKGKGHPCATIVACQKAEFKTSFQVPEPWSGRIETAPLLFLSSNPSISDKDVYPTGTWEEDALIDFFENRFWNGRREWIREGTKALAKEGGFLHATNFWAGVRQRAIELLGLGVRPGIDYALTEVVHCKSKQEVGVAEAETYCTERYLSRVLSASGARVIVGLGGHVKQVLTTITGISDANAVLGPSQFFGRERMLTFLPHPNARGVRSFSKCLPEHGLRTLQRFLSG